MNIIGASSFGEKPLFFWRAFFENLWHQIVYWLHLVLKIKIKSWLFGYSLQLSPSNMITKKIWDWRLLTSIKNQGFAEKPKTWNFHK